MRKIVLSAIAAVALSTSTVMAADMPVKAAPAAPASAWDIAFGSALVSDYIWRGITQSAHKPSVSAYFEPRYNINKDLQLYAGVAGNSIVFPNRAAAEIDLYAGIRPTFDKLALDFGVWYYWYPGGICYSTGTPGCQPTLLNGNVIKADLSFWEVYAKATYNVTDSFAVGATFNYSPSVLNSGADGAYYAVNAKYTGPAFSNGAKPYISGEVGYWSLGTSDAFYAVAGFPNGIPYKSYATWNLGIGATWKVFTAEIRYYDTNLSRGDCNAFTSDHTAIFDGSFTSINPGGVGSSWCDARIIGKISADLTANDNLK